MTTSVPEHHLDADDEVSAGVGDGLDGAARVVLDGARREQLARRLVLQLQLALLRRGFAITFQTQ